MLGYKLETKVSKDGKIFLPDEYSDVFNQEIELILISKSLKTR